jgi:Purple acid Phosphatase, N-terminal domain
MQIKDTSYKMKRKRIIHIFFLFTLGLLLAYSGTACRAAPPSVTLFTVTPAEINSGAESTLKWTVAGATSVTIDQGIGEVPASGSKKLSPARTTAYIMTATNADVTVTRAVVLYVTEPAPIAPAVDTTPPIINNVSTSSETETSVNVTWMTSEPANSYVEYGKDTSYGLTASSDELTADHSLTLTSLESNTAYHFRVASSDKAGNKGTSADNIFVTAQEKSPYALALVSEEWGRKADTVDFGTGPMVEGKKYLYLKGTLQNNSSSTLRAVIITMNCWAGNIIVKYEVYVYRGPALPGQVFSFNMETADDPTVDNVTADFADSSGRDIEVTKAQ